MTKKVFRILIIQSRIGGVILLFLHTVFHMNKYNYQKYKTYRFAYQYNKGKFNKKFKYYCIIDKGLYSYEYFNICYLNDMLTNIVFALSKGCLPIVDLAERKKGDNNWGMFFKQPFIENNSIDGMMKKDIFSDSYIDINFIKIGFDSHKDLIDKKIWMKLYRDFVVFNNETKLYIDDEYAELLKGKRTLGVLCRGTDYVGTKPANHPVQPEIKNVVKDAKVIMKDNNYQYIYLATEEKRIHDIFEEEFPGQIIINKRSYYDDSYYKQEHGTLIGDVHFERENDNYWKGLEYLSSIYLLSQCNALIGGNCGGSQAAVDMNDNKYEYVNLYDLGCY